MLLLTLQSCLNMTEPEFQAQYIESYKSFDKELVNHFPKKIPNNWISVVYGGPKYINKYSSTTEFSLTIQISSKEKFEKLKNQLKKEAKVIKNSMDSCLIIVDSKENQNTMSCNRYYPVPQEAIFEYKNKNDGWIRLKNCEVALLDYKPGIFIKSKYLTRKENLPKDWENGYSKGYAFNNKKQTIMYWLITW